MKFNELKLLLKKLYKEYVRKHIKKILIALMLSLVVAGSTSGIAWLLDPAVKKIFIDHPYNRELFGPFGTAKFFESGGKQENAPQRIITNSSMLSRADVVDQSADNFNVEHNQDPENMIFISARDIKKGEELYVNYGENYWNSRK